MTNFAGCSVFNSCLSWRLFVSAFIHIVADWNLFNFWLAGSDFILNKRGTSQYDFGQERAHFFGGLETMFSTLSSIEVAHEQRYGWAVIIRKSNSSWTMEVCFSWSTSDFAEGKGSRAATATMSSGFSLPFKIWLGPWSFWFMWYPFALLL